MSSTRPAFDVNRSLLGSGVALLCVGGVLWLGGAALSAAALLLAGRKWVEQWDESPSEIAHRRMEQVKAAAAAGSQAWRDQAH
jgi:hypothetical protein